MPQPQLNFSAQLEAAEWMGPPFTGESIRWLFLDQPRAAAAAWRLAHRWSAALAAGDAIELEQVLQAEVRLLDLSAGARSVPVAVA